MSWLGEKWNFLIRFGCNGRRRTSSKYQFGGKHPFNFLLLSLQRNQFQCPWLSLILFHFYSIGYPYTIKIKMTTNGATAVATLQLPIFDISDPTPEVGRSMIEAAAKYGFLYVDTKGTDF